MIETPLYTAISTSQPIAALIGARIYPVEVPQDATLPALDYKIIAATPAPTFSTRGITRYRVELNCWGSTYGQAVGLRDAVITALDGSGTPDLSMNLLMVQDFYEHELLQYRALVEFYILSTL